MVNGTTWEIETKSKLEYGKENLEKAKQDKLSAEERLDFWSDYVQTLEKMLELDRQHRGIKFKESIIFDPESLRNMSVKDAMIEVARANNGILKVIDAATILIDVGIFEDRDHARNSIYSNLSHNKRKFRKEQKGIYRLSSIKKEITLPLNP